MIFALLLQLVPAELPLPKDADPTKAYSLVRAKDEATVPAQVSNGRIVFLDRGQGDAYHLVPATAPAKSIWSVEEDPDSSFIISCDGRKAARYVARPVGPPAGLDPVYTRGGFLHPLWSPSGVPLTNASPKHHAHHYGVWSGWKRVLVDGAESDLWLPTPGGPQVEPLGVVRRSSGPVFAEFESRHRFVVKAKSVLEETWTVRVSFVEGRYVLDLTTKQEAQVDLALLEFRYGGIGFRGPADWEGKLGMTVLTSDGVGRIEAQGSRPKWTTLSGKGGTVGLIGHARNRRSPQSLRVHPDEPFFNWSVPADGDLALTKGELLELKYRLVLSEGPIAPEIMDTLSDGFSDPTKARLAP